MRSLLSQVVLAAAATLDFSMLRAQEAELGVGARAPIVTVHDLAGEPVDLGRYIGQRPVFLEFWATWCESCRELLPQVRAAHAKYGAAVEFIGINVTVNQTQEQVRKYIATEKPPFMTLYDDEGTSTRAYQVPATSYVVIVDRAGKIVYTGSGGSQQLEPALRQVTQN